MNQCTPSTISKDTYLLLLGAGIGVGLGILLAPRSGQATRHAIRDGVNSGKAYVASQGQDLAEKATDLVEQGRGIVDQGRETLEKGRGSITAALDAGRQAYRETVGPISSERNL